MNTILVLTEFTRRAGHAAIYSLQLAAEINCDVLLYHSYTSSRLTPKEKPKMRAAVLANLEQLAQSLKSQYARYSDHPCPQVRIEAGEGALVDTIGDISSRNDIYLLTMGGQKSDGAEVRQLFGATAYEVIERSMKPVIVVPLSAVYHAVHRIGFATGLHPTSQKAVLFLKDLGAIGHTEIKVLHVADKGTRPVQKLRNYERYMRLVSGSGSGNFTYAPVDDKDVADVLHSYIRNGELNILALVHQKCPFLERLFREGLYKSVADWGHLPVLVMKR